MDPFLPSFNLLSFERIEQKLMKFIASCKVKRMIRLLLEKGTPLDATCKKIFRERSNHNK